MDVIRTLSGGVASVLTVAYDILQEIVDLTIRGVKRSLEDSNAHTVDVNTTRTIAELHTNTPLAIEERSELLDGSVKRRRLGLNAHNTKPQNLRRSPTPQAEQLYRGRKTSAEIASTQRKIASLDITAGIDLAFKECLKSESPTSKLAQRRAFRNAIKTQSFAHKIPGTSQYAATYDLLTKSQNAQAGLAKRLSSKSRFHPYAPRQYKQAEATNSVERHQAKKSRGSRPERNAHRSSQSEGAAARSRITIEEEEAARKLRLEKERADEDAADAANAAKLLEEQAARKAEDDAEEEERLRLQRAKMDDEAAEAAREEQRKKEERATKRRAKAEASKDARRKARREAELKRREKASQHQQDKDAEEARVYAERTAIVEEEELEEPPRQSLLALKLREEQLWSPKDEPKMSALEEETEIKTKHNEIAQPVATPMKQARRPGREVRYLISPNSGLEAVQHKTFARMAPPTQLNTPDEPWIRDEFFTRPFDGYLCDEGKHPVTLPPRASYGLPPQYDEREPVCEEAHDTSIEMTDVSPLPAPPQPPMPAPVQAPSLLQGQGMPHVSSTIPSLFHPQAPGHLVAPAQGLFQGPPPTTMPGLFQFHAPAPVSAPAQGLFQGPPPVQVPAYVPAVPAPAQVPSLPGSIGVQMTNSATPQAELNTTTTTAVINGGINMAPTTNGVMAPTTNGVHLQPFSHSADSVSSSPATPSSNGMLLSSTPHTTISTSGSNGTQNIPSYTTPRTPQNRPTDDTDYSFLTDMSNLSMGKLIQIREARKAAAALAAANKKAAEEAAAEKARKEAEEAARIKKEEEDRIAKEKADAEAKAAEEERKKRGGRSMPTEKFVRPLSSDWDNRLRQEMSKGAMAPVTVTTTGTQLRVKDFATVLSPHAWLNDEIINSYLEQTVDEANKTAGSQKFASHNSFFYSSLSANGPSRVRRWMSKKKLGGEKMLDLEAVFVPVCQNAHWTLIVVSPRARTIEYFDSLHGRPHGFIQNIRAWLEMELGEHYIAEEWTVPNTACTAQNNGYDCGVFTITNAKCVALGFDPTCYGANDMAMQRRRIAAELIHKGTIL